MRPVVKFLGGIVTLNHYTPCVDHDVWSTLPVCYSTLPYVTFVEGAAASLNKGAESIECACPPPLPIWE